jgi:hypothetical protein
MIPVSKLTTENEPSLFDTNCRKPGAAWLIANPNKDPHVQSGWWSQFKPDLAKHFNHRCGWLGASIEVEGVVEHYLSCGNRKKQPSPHQHLAFEWSNYRYASGTVNSRKGNHDDAILDPCEIGAGWFEVILHGFQLLPTKAIPKELRDKAKFTLKTLELRNGYHARMARWKWYERYWNDGEPLLDLLEKDAPLVAAAVRKAQANGEELPNPNEHAPASEVAARIRPYTKRQKRVMRDKSSEPAVAIIDELTSW